MNENQKKWLGYAIVVAAIILSNVLFGYVIPYPSPPVEMPFGAQGYTNFTGLIVEAPTYQATNEPAMQVDNDGVSNVFEVLDGGTPALVVDSDGNTTISGTCSGCSVNSASGLRITQPTAATTATPALAVNSLAAGANLLEVQDASTPVFVVENGGDHTIAGNVAIAQPTAAATATPMVYANTAADAPDLLVVAKDATPVVSVHNDGTLDVEGDVDVGDTLNVDGDIDLDGDGFDVNITAGFSIDGDAASNININTGDLTIENEDKSIIIKGDEAAADAIYLDANDAAGTGVSIVTGASAGLSIDGGLTDIGGGTYTVADGDNDLGVEGDIETNGNLVLSSANYPVEHGSAGREIYFGVTSAFTGTTTVLSTTTGIENVVAALCQVDDPDDDSGDAFLCIGSHTDGDVTLTALDDSGDESTEVDTTVYYIILGY
jgi:hypothetical protein